MTSEQIVSPGENRWLRLFLKVRLHLFRPGHNWLESPLFWASWVGLGGALSSVAFREALQFLEHQITQSSEPIDTAAARFSYVERFLVPTLGGLVAGLILSLGNRLTTSAKSADFMEAVVLGNGMIRTRSTLIRSLSSLITNATGGSIGREGPMVQLSALFASLLGRWGNFSAAKRRLLVACGAAAGIACAYNAPFTGALFVAEILLGTIAMESFGPLVVASVVATVTVHQFLGAKPVYIMPEGLFETVPNWEMGAYVVMGILAGVCGPFFLAWLRAAEGIFNRLKMPVILRLASGGALVGLISMHAPQVWGNGYNVAESILGGSLVGWALVDILIFKVMATAATTGSGAVGGVFTPTLFTGAALGGLFGQGMLYFFPHSDQMVQSFAVVGMGCFLAATTRAPIMSILLVFEMTLNYGAVMPLMLACSSAFFVSRKRGGESMYSRHLRAKNVTAEAPLFLLHVRDLMKPRPIVVRPTDTFNTIVGIFALHTFKHLYVVDKEGRFVGSIALQELKPFLQNKDMPTVVIALDLIEEKIPVLTSEASLKESLEVFARHDGERLPVVDSEESGRLVGSLSKTDVLLTLAHGLSHAL